MKVRSKQEAWSKADVIFPTDYIKDDVRSERAGYDIYYSTAAGVHAWISDLGDRLEVNLATGEVGKFPCHSLRASRDRIYCRLHKRGTKR